MTTVLLYSDIQIVKAIKAGDRSILKHTYDRYWKTINQFILNNNGTNEEAEDVYQEAIVACFQNIRKEGFELQCKFSTYLFAICKRLWYKELQKKNQLYTEAFVLDISDDIDEDHLAQIEEREKSLNLMDQSISQLGVNCQQLIKSFYIEKKSMQEIALEMGYTNADNAKNQKYKCLQKLKKAFFERYSKENRDEYTKA